MNKKQKSAVKNPPSEVEGHRIVKTAAHFEGPLPPPNILDGYRSVKEDLPEIIIAEWQKEAASRREYSRRYSNREAARIAVVAIFAFGMLALAAWLAYKEQYALSAAVVISPLAVKLLSGLLSK